jgi:hypothetical protein
MVTDMLSVILVIGESDVLCTVHAKVITRAVGRLVTVESQ